MLETLFLAGLVAVFLIVFGPVAVYLTAKLWSFGRLRGREAFREYQDRKRRKVRRDESHVP